MRQVSAFLMVCCLVVAGVAPAVGAAAVDTTADPATTVNGGAGLAGQETANDSTNGSANDSCARDGTRTVTLLTYNDIQTAAARDGDFPRLVQLVGERRAAHDNPVVVAGAGDQVGPHPLSPVSQWRAPTAVLNLLQPDADVIGNHEFDYGLAEVSNFTAESEFPWLATNLVNSSTGESFDGTQEYEIVERDGVRIGFIGLVDYGATYGKTNIDFAAEGITLQNFTEDGPATAERLKAEEDVDVVVALAHTGIPEAEELANADDGAIDVIAVGDDELYYPPQETSDTVITEGLARAQFLGELNLTVDTDANDVTSWEGRLIQTNTSGVEKNASASDIINGYRANASLDTNVTYSTVPLDATFATNYHEESNYGNLVTDAMRDEANADVAITNAGGIRSDGVYGPGNITGGDIFSTLPFANTLVTVELTGAELKAALASQVVTLESETGQSFGEEISQQSSGVRFEWVPHEDADPQIRDVYVNANGPDEPADWQALDEDATYAVAVNSFMANGGSSYPLENATRISESGQLLAEVVIDYLEPRETVSPEVEGRMQRVDTTLDAATAELDGNGKVVLRFDAPGDLTDVNAGTFVLATPDNETVSAEQVTANGNSLVVRFDDAAVSDLVDSGESKLDLYGEYDSSEFEFVYFDAARLNADVTVTDTTDDAGEGDDGDDGDDGEENDGSDESDGTEDGNDADDSDDAGDSEDAEDGSNDAESSMPAYQIDVAAGEVIETLGDDEDDFYGAQDRLLQATTVLADGTVTGSYTVPDGTVTESLAGCEVTYDAVGYDADTGDVTLTVSVSEDADCAGVTLTLAGYELPGDDTTFVRANADDQELLDHETVTLDAGDSELVTVDLDGDDESSDD
ncbi:bifunctional metallophosphatase/5'-nucleotidase [Halomarina oriensis]|uniref:Bifunctional metallophosphatase/5'-nucleotidase n=1 Tax=Halomarina oriensis TaxID=671145 RepID=A0A6B0GL10_9EURY|nr:5'-nucleotidase C-terminal domain-containing protein [Halomarina oriensis]MWG34129.1 bifunctional metallophosphatase/5'-nucleotidase [Halomarina oriensis]